MAIWELAIMMFALTYMVVNIGMLYVMLKHMQKYDGILTKSIKLIDVMLDKAANDMEEAEKDI